MDKTYNPAAIETEWYRRWEERGYFRAGSTPPVRLRSRQVTDRSLSGADGSAALTNRNRSLSGAEGPVLSGVEGAYCIMLPPPNVTGSLHMGHAFGHTVKDALIRYHRMRGENTLWQPGTDHAGIATQLVVERQLGLHGKTRHDLGREEFVKAVWRWKEESGSTITRQMRRLGDSVDWSRERFTMDEGLSQAVTEVFVRLYEDGLIYRGKRLVNWDPVLHTAISDLEVISTEENGHLWHIRYPVADDGADYLVVATTRPETLLGDAAVAVHPDDERYQRLIGKQVHLPLTGRTISVIADEYVEREFGTGCLKITPAHDFNDYEVGERHGLAPINIFTPDAKLNDDVPAAYRGLDRFVARKKIVADLEAEGLLEKVQDHKLMVPRGDRSGAVIEPYLTDQWYVKIGPLAGPAIAAVEQGRVRFVPENWDKTYYEWMRNIQDWCISRQLWWGHRIPAWYNQDGNVYVARSESEAREKYQLNHNVILRQDEDVLDTWFSSALWPFSTLGWPDETPEFKTFYPTSVLVTGFDIIFFWVARMIMMGLKFAGEVPFREVYIHGLVRDADGQKMSKSKGNILDPIDLIDGIDIETLVKKRTTGLMRPQDASKVEKNTRKEFPGGIPPYGTDALRFTFASLATTGRNINFDSKRIEGYRNFCNKLWNAARYVLMATEGQDTGLGCVPFDSAQGPPFDSAQGPPFDSALRRRSGQAQGTGTEPVGERSRTVELGVADRWILSRLQCAIAAAVAGIETYRFDLTAQAIYEFAWDEYCDWYLELSKSVLSNADSLSDGRPLSGVEGRSLSGVEGRQRGTRQTLVRVLETLLRLAHPIMPFITEEIWQRVAPLAGVTGETIMRQPYPEPDQSLIDEAATRELEWLKTFILGIRRIRAEYNIKPGKPLPVLVRGGSEEECGWLKTNNVSVLSLARVESIDTVSGDAAPESATALAGGMTVLVPFADLIDPQAERERLRKERDKFEQEKQGCDVKLANSDFVQRAPAEVIAKQRARSADLAAAIQRLEEQLGRL